MIELNQLHSNPVYPDTGCPQQARLNYAKFLKPFSQEINQSKCHQGGEEERMYVERPSSTESSLAIIHKLLKRVNLQNVALFLNVILQVILIWKIKRK